MTAFSLVLLVSLACALLPGSIWAQYRQGYGDGGDPFGGVRYSSSRVASTPRRNSSQVVGGTGWNSARRPFVSYVTTSTTPAPSTTPSLSSHPVTGPPPLSTTTRPWYSPPSFLETERLSKTRPRHQKPTRYSQEVGGNNVIPEGPAKKRDHGRPRPDAWKADRTEYWKPRHPNTWKASHLEAGQASRPVPIKAAHEFAGTSEYRGIEEGSYFDRSNATAPPSSQFKFFNWEGDQVRRHRHGHGSQHHSTPSAVVPNVRDRYQRPPTAPLDSRKAQRKGHPHDYHAYESRPVTYRPRPGARGRTTTNTTTASAVTRAAARNNVRSGGSRSRTAVDGGRRYYEKERERHPSQIRHVSDRVSYVAGSYYPMGKSSRSRTRREVDLPQVHPLASQSGN